MYGLLVVLFLVFPNLSFAIDLDSDGIQVLIEKYAPLVKFHQWEEYFPSSIEWFLQRSSLVRERGGQIEELIRSPTVDQISQFAHLSAAKASSYGLSPKGRVSER